MIFDIFLFMWATIIEFILYAFSSIFTFTVTLTGLNALPGLAYIFGNVMLLNAILPVQELFFLALTALTFKAFILGYDIFMFVLYFFGRLKTVFLTWR
jgi:hypothetical protein